MLLALAVLLAAALWYALRQRGAGKPVAWIALDYAPAPPGNPLKGFLPFFGNYADFPHSMEYFNLPLAEVSKGQNNFDFSSLERRIGEIASRGHQSVFRPVLDTPGEATGVPAWLIEGGLKFTDYSEHGGGRSPDYGNPRLIAALEGFIRELGARYDGDPRVGCLEAGLIGFWGEWHTWPHDKLMPSLPVRNRISQAYHQALRRTPVLLRTPQGDSPGLNFGYHDDMFSLNTLPTQPWHFLAALGNAGLGEVWTRRPIGGEVAPSLQARRFEPSGPGGEAEDFLAAVRQSHATWLICHGLFAKPPQGPARALALEAECALGYELHVAAWRAEWKSAEQVEVCFRVENRGVAPFYLPWKAELALAGRDRALRTSVQAGFTLDGILPGAAREFATTLEVREAPSAPQSLLLRVPNPMPSGPPLRFANAAQDRDVPGWLTLGELPVSPGF